MQSLWATARRANRCGCRAYSTTVAGLGRRVTNAPRRKATLPEIFTASYSSVFASATLIDAVAKEERRRDLDRQVDETRRELNELRQQDAAGWVESSIDRLTDDQMDEAWDCLKYIYTSRPYFKEIHKPAMLGESDLRERLQRDFYNCTETTLDSLLRYKSTDGLRLSSAYEEVSNQISRRDPLSKDHLQHFGSSIEALVRQLLMRANARSSSSALSSSYDEAMRLLGAGYPYYQLRSIDTETAKLNTIRLNQANKVAINHPKIGIKEKIGRVCYNLLISAYPPDMHTFNSLMIELDGKRYTPFSEAIVNSFFYDTKLKPTPATFAAILYHYNVTRNHGMFLRTIACIVGLDQKTGAKIRHFHIDNAIDDPLYRRWAQNTRERTLIGDYIYDHLPLNRLVVEEILRGLIRFHMIEDAVSFFATCVRTGVVLTTTTVKQVFDGCLMALDWSAGMRLVQELVEHTHLWAGLMKSCDDKTQAHVVDRLYSIIDMLGFGESSRSISDERLKELDLSSRKIYSLKKKVRVTASSLPERLEVRRQRGSPELDDDLRAGYSRALQIESLWKESVRVRKTTKSIESKLLKYPLTLEVRVSMADQIGHDAIEKSQRLSNEIQESLGQWDIEGQLGNLEQPWLSRVSEKPLIAENAISENTAQASMPLLSTLAATPASLGPSNAIMDGNADRTHG